MLEYRSWRITEQGDEEEGVCNTWPMSSQGTRRLESRRWTGWKVCVIGDSSYTRCIRRGGDNDNRRSAGQHSSFLEEIVEGLVEHSSIKETHCKGGYCQSFNLANCCTRKMR